MKISLKLFLGLLLLSLGIGRVAAQSQPVLTVSITKVTVVPTSGPITVFAPPDESYGPTGTQINITALGVGTFPVAGYTYAFSVNGYSIGTLVPNPLPASLPGTLSWTPPAPGAYNISVTITDGTNSATSLPIRYFAVGAAISSPLANTIVPVGSSVVVKADATPAQGFIQKIDFYDGGTLIGTDTTYPYSAIYTPSGPAGTTHTFSVVATDNNGGTLTSPGITVNMVTPVGAPPVAFISTPTDGSLLPIPNYGADNSANIPINVTASAVGQIKQVEIYVDGTLLATPTAFPYSTTTTGHAENLWKPSAVGTYRLTALAYDDKNNVTATSTNTVRIGAPPTVSITSPSANSSISAGSATTVTANASDSDGTIASVQFFADGVAIGTATSAPYTITYLPKLKADGTLTVLTAVATDNDRLTTTSVSVPIQVNSGSGGGGGVVGIPPVVSIGSPANGAVVLVNAPVNLTALATDADGNIVSVQFLINNTVLSTTTTFPYSATWTPTSVGTFAITAKATDNSGNAVTSTPISVIVSANSSGLPSVAITSPANNVSGIVNNSLAITANASDPDGTISLVEFYADGQLLGSKSAAPYAFVWTPLTAKTYQLTAVATDNGGNRVTSAPVAVNISYAVGSIPVASLVVSDPAVDSTSTATPTALAPINVSYGSKLVISSVGIDSDGYIARVDFYANGVAIASLTQPPYSFVWQLNTLQNVTISAIATDNSGNAYSMLPVLINTQPSAVALNATVTLNSPADGAVYSAGGQIVFAATTNLGNVTPPKVDFYLNGFQFQTVTAPPYQYTVGLSQPGTYYVQAIARQGTLVTASGTSKITIVANQPPTVSVSAPSTGATYKLGTTINLTASAADPDGTIANVKFFVNGNALSTATGSPYTATFNPAAPGVYAITAVATDNGGAATASSPINVLVYTATASNSDAIYTGTYGVGSEAGVFAAIVSSGKWATFIAHSTTGTPRSFYYSDLPVNATGGFSQVDSTGKKLLSVTASDGNSISGTLDGGRLVLIGLNPSVFGQNTYTGAGLYNGNLTGHSASTITGIVAADASIMLYISDGSYSDAGDGTITTSTGALTVTTLSGNKFTGKIDPATHFLTGTLSGSTGGSFSGALASGGAFSDGVLKGLATRGFVGTGNNVLIAGFFVDGTASVSTNVLVRGIGPSLAGVSNLLADPQLKVFNGANLIASNDNWGSSSNAAAISSATSSVGISALSSTSLDAVVYTQLTPGAYTAQVNGANNTTGNALIEIYDTDNVAAFSSQRVRAISTRGFVGTTGNELISGFIITGTTPKKVLIQAVGPGIASSLGSAVLQDPTVQLVSASGAVIRDNDNWESGNDPSLVTDAITKSGASPLVSGSKDSAILISLPPGAYTAVVRGVNNTTGIALVNVFEVQ